MGVQPPAVEEAIIGMTSILAKNLWLGSTGTTLLSSCWLLQSLNSVVLFFGGGGFRSPEVPEFVTHFVVVMFVLVPCSGCLYCLSS